jgi:hypothetical protein
MKKILTICLLLLSFNVFSMNESGIRTTTICQDGYKFLVIWYTSGANRPPNIVQIFERTINRKYPPQPMRCK